MPSVRGSILLKRWTLWPSCDEVHPSLPLYRRAPRLGFETVANPAPGGLRRLAKEKSRGLSRDGKHPT